MDDSYPVTVPCSPSPRREPPSHTPPVLCTHLLPYLSCPSPPGPRLRQTCGPVHAPDGSGRQSRVQAPRTRSSQVTLAPIGQVGSRDGATPRDWCAEVERSHQRDVIGLAFLCVVVWGLGPTAKPTRGRRHKQLKNSIIYTNSITYIPLPSIIIMIEGSRTLYGPCTVT